jgi:hypothetical protein
VIEMIVGAVIMLVGVLVGYALGRGLTSEE